jgi:putative flippase GtrA
MLMLSTLSPERRTILGQLIRFGLVGGFVTGLYAVVYSPLAKFHVVSPQIANFCGYIAAMVTGYVLHSKWSFRGHGSRDNPAGTTFRFFLVSLVSYAMNAGFVFVLTDSKALGGPWWWPLIPIVFVTPAITFLLNRYWVFR